MWVGLAQKQHEGYYLEIAHEDRRLATVEEGTKLVGNRPQPAPDEQFDYVLKETYSRHPVFVW